MAKPGTCSTLVYTSGTTGNPKGVMLSHDNYYWTAKTSLMKLLQNGTEFGEDDCMLSFLPLSHVAAQLMDVVGAMIANIHVWFADSTAL